MKTIRDMESVYWKRSSKDLRRLRSEKLMRLAKLRSQWMGYLVQQEIRALSEQVMRIDAILAARDAQTELPDA